MSIMKLSKKGKNESMSTLNDPLDPKIFWSFMTKKVIVRYDRSPDSSFMVHLCVGNSCWNAVQTEKNLLGCIWRSQTTIRRGNFDWHALKQCYTTLQSLWKWQIQYTHKSTHLLCTKYICNPFVSKVHSI